MEQVLICYATQSISPFSILSRADTKHFPCAGEGLAASERHDSFRGRKGFIPSFVYGRKNVPFPKKRNPLAAHGMDSRLQQRMEFSPSAVGNSFPTNSFLHEFHPSLLPQSGEIPFCPRRSSAKVRNCSLQRNERILFSHGRQDLLPSAARERKPFLALLIGVQIRVRLLRWRSRLVPPSTVWPHMRLHVKASPGSSHMRTYMVPRIGPHKPPHMWPLNGQPHLGRHMFPASRTGDRTRQRQASSRHPRACAARWAGKCQLSQPAKSTERLSTAAISLP